MKKFRMCVDCEREYHDPQRPAFSRATECRVRVAAHSYSYGILAGQVIASKEEALRQAVESVRAGKIIALKGLGGFQLIVDAANERVSSKCASANIAKRNRLR